MRLDHIWSSSNTRLQSWEEAESWEHHARVSVPFLPLPTQRVSSARFRVFFYTSGTDISFVSRESCQEHPLPSMEIYPATQNARKATHNPPKRLHQTESSS